MSKKFGTLSDIQRNNIARAIAGRRHFNSLIIALRNWDQVNAAVNDSINSQGSALERNNLTMESLEKRITRLKNSYQELALGLGDSELGKVLFGSINLFNTFLKSINQLIRDVPALGSVLTGALGLGAVAGLVKLIGVTTGIKTRNLSVYSKALRIAGKSTAGFTGSLLVARTAVTGFLGPIGLVIAAVSAAAIVYDLLITSIEEIK